MDIKKHEQWCARKIGGDESRYAVKVEADLLHTYTRRRTEDTNCVEGMSRNVRPRRYSLTQSPFRRPHRAASKVAESTNLRILSSGGILDSQTTDTQYFGFDELQSQVDTGGEEPVADTPGHRGVSEEKTREPDIIFEELRKARDVVQALESEFMNACMGYHYPDEGPTSAKHDVDVELKLETDTDTARKSHVECVREGSVVSTSDDEEHMLQHDQIPGVAFQWKARRHYEESQEVEDPPTYSLESQIFNTIIQGYSGCVHTADLK